MSTTQSRINVTTTFLLAAALFLSGCKQAATPGVRNSDGSITNSDGSVTYPAGTMPPAPQTPTPVTNPDGSVTNPDGSVTYPAASPRAQTAKAQPAPAATPAPMAMQPKPAPQAPPPPPPAPIAQVVPSGTGITVTITETLSASRNNAGDRFSGVLARSVMSHETVVFPRGTRVTGVVAAAKGKGRFKGAGDLAIELTSIGGTRVSTTEYEAINKGRGKRTAGFVGGGTGLGAIIGGLAGGGKGALIGGLAGAGAGTAGAAYTGSRDVVIPSESTVTFRLTESVSVR